MPKNLESVKSFRDRWIAFVGVYDDLQDQTPVDREHESAFLNARISLLERFQELKRSGLGKNMPEHLIRHFDVLSRYEKVGSLSDTQLKGLKSVVMSITSELNTWLESTKRESGIRNLFAQSERREVLYKFVVIPASFAALVILFTWVGIKAFLNR